MNALDLHFVCVCVCLSFFLCVFVGPNELYAAATGAQSVAILLSGYFEIWGYLLLNEINMSCVNVITSLIRYEIPD